MNSVHCFTRGKERRADPSQIWSKAFPALATSLAALWLQAPLPAQGQTQVSLGGAPAGTFAYDLGPEQGVPLWNFSGSYVLPFYGEVRLQHYPNGWIGAFYAGETNLAPSNTVLQGTVMGPSSRPIVRLRTRVAVPFEGPDVYWDLRERWRRRDVLTVAFDPAVGNLAGKDYVTHIWYNRKIVFDPAPGGNWFGGRYHFEYEPESATRAQPLTLDAPTTADGRWTLVLELASVGNRVNGTAEIEFTNGEVFQLQAAGTYFPKADKTRVLLQGAGTAKGSYLVLTLAGPQLNLQWLRGRVGGQSLHSP